VRAPRAVRRTLVVYNPTAGRRRQAALLAELVPRLEAGGVSVEPVATESPGHGTAIARRAAAEGYDAVLVLGGDGTVREVAAGLMREDGPGAVPRPPAAREPSPAAAARRPGPGERPPRPDFAASVPLLGILPAGTTNVLAHALGLPADPRAAADLAARLLAEGAPPRRLDVGLAAGKPFLMMASAGFDAFVLERLDPRWKARLGRVGIVLTAARELVRYHYPELEIEADGEPVAAGFAAVCNVPYYGGPYALAPRACCDDRRLDLVTFAGSGYADTLAFGLALARGTHLARADVAVRPVDRVVVRGPSGAAVQIDGDPCGAEVPVTIELAPDPLAVLAPSASLGPR